VEQFAPGRKDEATRDSLVSLIGGESGHPHDEQGATERVPGTQEGRERQLVIRKGRSIDSLRHCEGRPVGRREFRVGVSTKT